MTKTILITGATDGLGRATAIALARQGHNEQRPLSEGASAFQDLRTGAVAAPKIILNPWA